MNRRGFLKAMLQGAAITAAGLYVPKAIYSFPTEPHALNLAEPGFKSFSLPQRATTLTMWVKVPGRDEPMELVVTERGGVVGKATLDGRSLTDFALEHKVVLPPVLDVVSAEIGAEPWRCGERVTTLEAGYADGQRLAIALHDDEPATEYELVFS